MTKRRSRLAIALAGLLLLVGCGQKSSDTSGSAGTAKEGVSIGVIQLAPHNALDQSYQGFLDGLAEAGYVEGKNLKLDFNNALGDPSNATTIAQKLVNEKPDLIFAIATPSAQAAANQTSDIPIVITAVTDPEQSGLVESNARPGGNVTGTSDLTPVADQIALLKQLVPEAKRVGVLFSSSEDNSIIQARLAREAIEANGLEYVELTVTKTDEIVSVTQSVLGKVDALYVPTDNLISANMGAVTGVTTPAGLPVICGEAAMLESGGLATTGIDYYKLGKQSAQMAASILKGELQPAEMPIQYQEEKTLSINEEVAKELGIELPSGLK
ncbi:MAG: ABC transporter substrate-binding protein [Ndongobacter sp.]|nr:ABC transporter substrate-binding protein [Ndongobacter sp.]